MTDPGGVGWGRPTPPSVHEYRRNLPLPNPPTFKIPTSDPTTSSPQHRKELKLENKEGKGNTEAKKEERWRIIQYRSLGKKMNSGKKE